MKNPFVKQHNNGALVAAIALGSVAASATAYLFLTERGSGIRGRIAERFGKLGNMFSKKAAEVHEEPAAYLKKSRKAPKTDREELLHHEVINEHPDLTK
ncbi:hypothetical protein BEL04_09120 [Mucilaginibacter sp. PPCGB 2223]|uniref:hypothetical protein n=1 Tax=Mucilaginibacter sp. PPCGB 2223 TaxID=1886027 RepID=UPI000825381F|nr:hypothetical protein [Mucilaginibacter sp. PPCGB 2223]OCX54401.1 hypothetical protein BEL04_09120 [Mucilaginibacter sp. PPCGB 2223]